MLLNNGVAIVYTLFMCSLAVTTHTGYPDYLKFALIDLIEQYSITVHYLLLNDSPLSITYDGPLSSTDDCPLFITDD